MAVVAAFFAQLTGRKDGAFAPAGAASPVPVEKTQAPLFKEFWNPDRCKTAGQALVTVGFFTALTAAMDAIVFMPFRDNPDAADILALAMKFSPSLLVSVALTAVVAMGRNIPLAVKGGAIAVAAGTGFFFGSLFAVGPLYLLLLQPVREEPEVLDEDVQMDSGDFLLPPDSIPPESPVMAAPAPALMEGESGDEAGDEYADPLAEFIKKRD